MESLTKLFNFVFEKGEFPKIWNETFIVPLHKTCSKSDPSNYRGLSISSNLGKVFNKIIHLRLIKFTLDNDKKQIKLAFCNTVEQLIIYFL